MRLDIVKMFQTVLSIESLKFPLTQLLSKVPYICVSFLLLAHESCVISEAETKMIVVNVTS